MSQKINFGKMLLFSGVVVLLMLALSVWAWGQLPDNARIPTHWNARGEVNGYSTKSMGLMLMPLFMAGLSVLLAVLPQISPRRENLLQSLRVYKVCWTATLLLFFVLHAVAVFAALGVSIPMAGIINVGIGLFFMVMGNLLGKVRSNFIMGVRTPWTLSSELSWNKTHRLAGKLFVMVGLSMVIMGLFFSTRDAAAKVMLYGIILLVMVPVVYSWWVWKNDPNRQS